MTTAWFCWVKPSHYFLQSIHFFVYFKDDSITKATSGGAGNVGEFNPFSATEMVWFFFLFFLFSY